MIEWDATLGGSAGPTMARRAGRQLDRRFSVWSSRKSILLIISFVFLFHISYTWPLKFPRVRSRGLGGRRPSDKEKAEDVEVSQRLVQDLPSEGHPGLAERQLDAEGGSAEEHISGKERRGENQQHVAEGDKPRVASDPPVAVTSRDEGKGGGDGRRSDGLGGLPRLLLEEEARGFDWPVPLSGPPPEGKDEAACMRWLGDKDKTTYERNFDPDSDPITVESHTHESKPVVPCAVGCVFDRGLPSYDVTFKGSGPNCKFPDRQQSASRSLLEERENKVRGVRDGGLGELGPGFTALRRRFEAGVDAGLWPRQQTMRQLAADVVRRCPLQALISMESSVYYPYLGLKSAHDSGFNVVMTTNLESEVPAQYFSWAEYDIMAPIQNKTRTVHAAAFVSNCNDNAFRQQAIQELPKYGVSVDSWGRCFHNVAEEPPNGGDNKLATLRHYRFCLAFENSIEPDYTTEKFFQCLVAGSVPVVIGSPTILDFEPAPNTVLHIPSALDIPAVAERIKEISANQTEYDRMLSWKTEGPSDQFKALMDLSIVHSSCRLCIFTATAIRASEEEEQAVARSWPCRCLVEEEGERGQRPVRVYHLFVRERGRFAYESVFVRSTNLTTEAVKAEVKRVFEAKRHKPLFQEATDRPAALRGLVGDPLSVYHLYPAGESVRSYMFGPGWFRDGSDFLLYLKKHPCPRLEVIFV